MGKEVNSKFWWKETYFIKAIKTFNRKKHDADSKGVTKTLRPKRRCADSFYYDITSAQSH